MTNTKNTQDWEKRLKRLVYKVNKRLPVAGIDSETHEELRAFIHQERQAVIDEILEKLPPKREYELPDNPDERMKESYDKAQWYNMFLDDITRLLNELKDYE